VQFLPYTFSFDGLLPRPAAGALFLASDSVALCAANCSIVNRGVLNLR
jgi:hypothetical protein